MPPRFNAAHFLLKEHAVWSLEGSEKEAKVQVAFSGALVRTAA